MIMKLKHDTVDVDQILSLVKETDAIIFDENSVQAVYEKGAADYVTRVDMGVQRFLQEKLTQLTPSVGFIGEEQPRFRADPQGSYWILDPIDGTTNLIHHYGMSAVSLGLYEKGKITFGTVYNPFRGEYFCAVKGQGAWLNGKRIRVSETGRLDHALVSYGSSPYEKERAHDLFAFYEQIFVRCADFRRCGSAALDLCYVACGRQEAYLEQNLKPWDYAAGALILQEAGGRISDWGGRELPWLENGDVLATNGRVEGELRSLLSGGNCFS